MNRDFRVSRKNQVWVSDITYIETKQGWVYLTVIIDLFNRKIVGWSMSEDLSTEKTIVPAWNMAIVSTVITEGLIFHSDRGSQYASHRFTGILKGYGKIIKQSMSRKGNCWDNISFSDFENGCFREQKSPVFGYGNTSFFNNSNFSKRNQRTNGDRTTAVGNRQTLFIGANRRGTPLY